MIGNMSPGVSQSIPFCFGIQQVNFWLEHEWHNIVKRIFSEDAQWTMEQRNIPHCTQGAMKNALTKHEKQNDKMRTRRRMELMTMAQVEWRKWIRSHTEPKTMTSVRCTRWYQKAQDDIFDFLYILFLFLSTITSQYVCRKCLCYFLCKFDRQCE
jgi:hypothetical protein